MEATPAMLSPHDNQICFATPQGWIFIIHGASPWETWLWHPITRETIPLPPIRDDHYVPTSCTCLLTHSSAAHPDCAVVLFDVEDPDMWFCPVNGGSNRAWGQHTYDVGEYTLPDPEPEDVSDGDGDSTSAHSGSSSKI
uniref:KIB1-4 beta-propeller domain-containing protein n=1 Tax=Aegilops tauschii TaxID=37682 RepID=R7WC63_AEGTA